VSEPGRLPVGQEVAVLVFAKAPVPGTVKTRLVPALGADGAARLHERLVRRTLSSVVEAGIGEIQLWCSPGPAYPMFQDLVQTYRVRVFTQRGADLGERMAHALDTALGGGRAAVLVGTDCLDLMAEDLVTAAQALGSGCDAVLGPAADGGYVLVGLRTPLPELFHAVPWGTDAVLDRSRQILRRLGRRWRELEVRHDVDRPEDLARLPLDLRP
jgi:rSAM/selenodomain-associated transferase 1